MPELILASGDDLARGHHYFNDPKDGVEGHSGPGEVYDHVFWDAVAFVHYADLVVDFVNGSGVSAG